MWLWQVSNLGLEKCYIVLLFTSASKYVYVREALSLLGHQEIEGERGGFKKKD